MRCFNKYFYLNKLVYASFFHVLVTCLCHLSVNAQFVDVSNNLQLSTDHTGGFLGTGVSFADFNGDYIDDLTFGHHAGQIKFYQGDTFPQWNNSLLVGSLKFRYLSVLPRLDNGFGEEKIIFQDKIGRIRDIEINQKGEIYLIADESKVSFFQLMIVPHNPCPE